MSRRLYVRIYMHAYYKVVYGDVDQNGWDEINLSSSLVFPLAFEPELNLFLRG